MKAKVIFCDTNVIFGLFYRIISKQSLHHSVLTEVAKYYDVYISEKIIKELEKNIFKEYDLLFDVDDVRYFLQFTGIKLVKSNDFRKEMIQFVYDPDDAQIVQDAVDIDADFLITKNLKDFNIPRIAESFGINIINSLPPLPSLS